jgi:hypothetical protein
VPVPRKPPLSVAQVLPWADPHWVRTGQWPGTGSSHILDEKPGPPAAGRLPSGLIAEV